MEKLLFIITLVSLYATSAEGLKCFVCQNCPIPSKSDESDCNSITTTTITTLSTDEASTDSSTLTTEDSTTITSTLTTQAITSTGDTATSSQQTKRKKRFAQDQSMSNDGCTCYDNGYCNCSRKIRVRREDQITEEITTQTQNSDQTTTEQVTTETPTTEEVTTDTPTSEPTTNAQATINSETVVDRGCSKVVNGTTDAPCDITNTYGCYWCESELCNSARSLKFSISLIIFVFINQCISLQ